MRVLSEASRFRTKVELYRTGVRDRGFDLHVKVVHEETKEFRREEAPDLFGGEMGEKRLEVEARASEEVAVGGC